MNDSVNYTGTVIILKGTVRKQKRKENLLILIPLDVDEFVSSSEEIWRNLALHHLLTNGSSAVNGCRQNERTKQLIKNHHNNPQVIHTTPVH